jgi:hypothetical protein
VAVSMVWIHSMPSPGGGKGMNFFLKFQTKITLFFEAKINVISFSLQLGKMQNP